MQKTSISPIDVCVTNYKSRKSREKVDPSIHEANGRAAQRFKPWMGKRPPKTIPDIGRKSLDFVNSTVTLPVN